MHRPLRIMAVTTVLTLGFGVAACSATGDDGDAASTTTEQRRTATTQDETTTTEEETTTTTTELEWPDDYCEGSPAEGDGDDLPTQTVEYREGWAGATFITDDGEPRCFAFDLTEDEDDGEPSSLTLTDGPGERWDIDLTYADEEERAVKVSMTLNPLEVGDVDATITIESGDASWVDGTQTDCRVEFTDITEESIDGSFTCATLSNWAGNRGPLTNVEGAFHAVI